MASSSSLYLVRRSVTRYSFFFFQTLYSFNKICYVSWSEFTFLPLKMAPMSRSISVWVAASISLARKQVTCWNACAISSPLSSKQMAFIRLKISASTTLWKSKQSFLTFLRYESCHISSCRALSQPAFFPKHKTAGPGRDVPIFSAIWEWKSNPHLHRKPLRELLTSESYASANSPTSTFIIGLPH